MASDIAHKSATRAVFKMRPRDAGFRWRLADGGTSRPGGGRPVRGGGRWHAFPGNGMRTDLTVRCRKLAGRTAGLPGSYAMRQCTGG